MTDSLDGSKGGKWTDYAKAVSIIVAAVLSIVTYYKSCKTDDNLSEQKDKINVIKQRVDSMDNILNKQAKVVSNSLSFKNIKQGDTINTTTFKIEGNIDKRPDSEFRVYGMIKIINQYNTMTTPVEIDAKGNWECEFTSFNGAGWITICLVICDKESSIKLRDQINAGNYKLQELRSGMQIVGSINVYIK